MPDEDRMAVTLALQAICMARIVLEEDNLDVRVAVLLEAAAAGGGSGRDQAAEAIVLRIYPDAIE